MPKQKPGRHPASAQQVSRGILQSYPLAKSRLDEIWDYSDLQWGEAQADIYLRKLHHSFQRLADGIAPAHSCTRFDPECSPEILYYTAGSHYIIFRFASDNEVEILTVIHTRGADQISSFLRGSPGE